MDFANSQIQTGLSKSSGSRFPEENGKPVTEYLDQLKYQNEWDPKAYLASNYCDPLQFDNEFKHAIKFYSSFPNNSLTILEYSGGPSILNMISAVPKASKIIFSDFVASNRDEVRLWLDNKPGAFDWKPAIKHCLELEGGSDSTKDVLERESALKEKIVAVVSCDLASNNIIEEGYEGPYDVVSCDGVLDAICKTKDQYIESMKKLSTLVQEGGYLLSTADNSESYNFSDIQFVTPLQLDENDIEEAYTAAGLSVVHCNSYSSCFDCSILVIGQKQ